MAKWGSRVALAVATTAAVLLLATVLATTASASGGERWETGFLDIEADFTGPNDSKLWVQVDNCPPGSILRLTLDQDGVDGKVRIGDFIVPESGRFTLLIPIDVNDPPTRFRAFCWPVFALDSIPLEFGGGDDGDDGMPGDGGIDGGGTDGGTDGTDGASAGDDGDGDGGTDGGSRPPDVNTIDFNQFDDCVQVRGADLSLYNVVGDTFITDQGYTFVGMWSNAGGVFDLTVGQFDGWFNVAFNETLRSSSGDPIIKLKLCDPLGKPGYTPGELDVYAKRSVDELYIKTNVDGCPTGSGVDIFIDGIYRGTFVVGPGDEFFRRQIPNPGGPLETLKAVCLENGAIGITDIDLTFPLPPTSTVGSTAASQVAAESAQGSEAVEAASAVQATTLDIQPLVAQGTATGAALEAAIAAGEAKGATWIPLERGIPAGAGDAGVQLVALNPAETFNFSGPTDLTVTGGGLNGVTGALQIALGVLAGAGLLAFIGLRRVAKATP